MVEAIVLETRGCWFKPDSGYIIFSFFIKDIVEDRFLDGFMPRNSDGSTPSFVSFSKTLIKNQVMNYPIILDYNH